ncbi:polysaccharide biosynthesis tyrosine autokinase [Bacillus sp. FJAT-42376]|uniref:CpsD/CapB family tyrosine-protein kinase n=1 Tax=Bacillus sp. FJAT-42376 TaxID=2014076 RepID=UPI000F4E8CD1|nr:CpsD/CapB family tyrosine-protein kinase [Bacillus sp. FJAT-42376]AZB43595.1 polysaccharide biosynthesis tyrosine autokinase [Bacillus sp. FJAT-42376]
MLHINKRSATKTDKHRLISFFSPMSKIADQYRSIRTNIQLNPESEKFTSFIVTSPGYKEGKSTTSANLAISFSSQGKKVLLIDGDSRKPSLHTTFKIDNTVGLSDVLRGVSRLEEAVGRTEIGRMDIMTSGAIKFNHSELLASPSLRNIIQYAGREYDCIVIDAPPILETSDVKVMANQCEGLILVARAGRTDQSKLVEAKKRLETFDTAILGIILNDLGH